MIDQEMRLEGGIRLRTDQVSGLASFRREMSRRGEELNWRDRFHELGLR